MNALFCFLVRFLELPAAPAGASCPGAAELMSRCRTAYSQVLTQLGADADQARAARTVFLTELVRRLPQLVTAVALTALLPLVADRARARFRGAGESPETAEELSQEVVAKLLGALFGHWPRGNVGAFVATVCARTLCDRLREREREEKILTWAKDNRRASGY